MMTNGMNIEQRDILLIPFPYSDMSQEKKRPVLILSNREHNRYNADVICCAITSNPRQYENSIELRNGDLESGSLNMDSRIKPNKIFTLSKSNVIKKLGKVNKTKTKEVIDNLNLFIEIDA